MKVPPAGRSADFRPHRLLSHPNIQSILASKSPRRRLWLRRGNRMEAVAHHHLLEVGGGVRLSGWYSPQIGGADSRGLVVLIHGWEGSHESVYLYSMACRLYAAGWNIFRLNLRDHAGTHHLNREMFNSVRFDEVLGAFRCIRAIDAHPRLAVIGFSLGGNFALRVGLLGPAAGITPALSIGICPAINPDATLRAIDQGPMIFRRYFSDKWRQSLRAKAAAWPGLYDIGRHLRAQSIVQATEWFVADFTDFRSYDDYVGAYTLRPDLLMQAPSPLAIITSQDDPVIPYADFAGLRVAGSLRAYDATLHGGHCGFIENFAMETWSEKRVLELLAALD